MHYTAEAAFVKHDGVNDQNDNHHSLIVA